MIEDGHILKLSILLTGLTISAFCLKGKAGGAVAGTALRAAVACGLSYIARRYRAALLVDPAHDPDVSGRRRLAANSGRLVFFASAPGNSTFVYTAPGPRTLFSDRNSLDSFSQGFLSPFFKNYRRLFPSSSAFNRAGQGRPLVGRALGEDGRIAQSSFQNGRQALLYRPDAPAPDPQLDL